MCDGNSLMGGCGMSMEICDCACHRLMPGLTVNHMMACCGKCPVCQQNIVTHFYEQHVKACRDRYKLPEPKV